ncbi:MAG: diacylglycerol kinase family lipid kinase [Pyrinomonadaceae bacterium MAG19_C2-C3]|nr:diacylglycerol kinase family lipid kinase [Pyrinomonadaceae bacterium MAG19_C2-C3]
MKSRLIVNPVSGTDAAPDFLQTINERLRADIGEMDIVMTTAAGDARAAGESAAREGYARLYVAGGDGTLNEVLNGVASVEGGLEQMTFGLIPLGTGNDFADALGLPEDVEAALDILLAERTIQVDVGRLNESYFINVSAGGFIAEVSDAVNPELKSIAGKLAYLVGGAQVLLEYEAVPTHVREDGGAGEEQFDMQMFAVCNSRMIGGGRLIAPHAVIDDGAFDVCIVRAMPMLEFISLLTRVSSGDHVEDERVRYFQARELEMHFGREIKVNTDGEVLTTDVCRYALLPRAARFIAGEAPFAGQ